MPALKSTQVRTNPPVLAPDYGPSAELIRTCFVRSKSSGNARRRIVRTLPVLLDANTVPTRERSRAVAARLAIREHDESRPTHRLGRTDHHQEAA